MSKNEIVKELDKEEFLSFMSKTFSVKNDFLLDNENFKSFFTKFYTYMKQGFEKKEIRSYPVKIKFGNNPNERVFTLELRHVIINMIFWRAFISLDKVDDLNSSHIVNCQQLTDSYVKNWINSKIIDPYRTDVTNRKMNHIVENITRYLSNISEDFNIIMGISISIESFIELSKKNKRFNEIIRSKLEKGLQPKEIEDKQHRLMHELLGIIRDEPSFCLYPMIHAGAGIKDKQLAEFTIMGANKPDVNGNTIPVPIDSNFMIGGLNTVENYFVDSQAGRKSVILNKTSMGLSGFFAAKSMMASSKVHLSKKLIKDIKLGRVKGIKNGVMDPNQMDGCDTKRPIKYFVKNQTYLNKINRRFYYKNDKMDKLYYVNSKVDKQLIGKYIYLRSPMTCTCEDGICAICYGGMAYTNAESNFKIGAYASSTLSNTIQQNILSTKHLLATNSELIKFDENFYRFFTLESNRFKLNQDSDEKMNEWVIRIYTEDLYEFNEKEENDFNSHTERFFLFNKKTKEELEIKELNNSQEMYIYNSIISKFTKNKDKTIMELPLSALEGDDTYLAIIIIENNELTKPLKNIMRLLDRKDHYDCVTIDDMVNKMCDLLVDCNHKLHMVHGECVMRELIRDKDNILIRPAFNDAEKTEDYQILTISSALLNNSSLTVSLSFQDLGKQLINPNTNIKCDFSSYDYLYEENL